MSMDMILFLGQSNMVGETETLLESDPVPGAWEYRLLADELVPLRDPVGENTGRDLKPVYPYEERSSMKQWLEDTVFEASCEGRTSLIPSFTRAYIAKTGRNVVAVPAAKGCTRASYWLPLSGRGRPAREAIGYSAIVHKACAAIRRAGGVDRVFAVWLQGESDMLAQTDSETYIGQVTSIKDALKADLGLSRFGIIRVGRFSSLATWIDTPMPERIKADETIMAAQDVLCKRDRDFAMLTRLADELITGDRKYANPNVAGHFSALGLQVLGQAAGTALGAIAAESGDSTARRTSAIR